jgi:hypothetical protein
MSDIFISHVEEDEGVALEIVGALEAAGYTTWYYERDSVPGPSYLLQTKQAVEESRAVIVIVSPPALASPQLTKEVVRAHESGKPFIPVLRDVAHAEFQRRQPEWWEAMGAAASVRIPPEGVAAVLPRILGGLRALGILSKAEEARIVAEALAAAERAAAAGDWDAAAAGLERAARLAPADPRVAALQASVRAGQSRQEHAAQLAEVRARGGELEQAGQWDEALAAWRQYLALEPEDREAAQAAIAQIEKTKGLAGLYAEAQAALAAKDYERATRLLREIVVRDVTYKDAAALLAKAVSAGRPGGGKPWQRRGLLIVVAAGVVLIGLVVGMALLLPGIRAPRGSETPPSFAQAPRVTTGAGAAQATDGAAEAPARTPPGAPTIGVGRPSPGKTQAAPKATPAPAQPTAAPAPSGATQPTPAPAPVVASEAGLDGRALWPMPGGGPKHWRQVAFAGPAHADFDEASGFYDAVLRSDTAVGRDGIRYSNNGSSLKAVAPNGTQLWEALFANGSIYDIWAPLLAADGTIYALDNQLKLRAVVAGGTPKWTFTLGKSGWPSQPTLAADGTIYVEGGGVLTAITPAGRTKWKVNGAGASRDGVSLGDDGTVYTADARGVKAFTPRGTLQWEGSAEAEFVSSPLLTDGGIYGVGATDSQGRRSVLAFDRDGKLRWSVDAGASYAGRLALGLDGLLYVRGKEELLAITQDGQVAWRASVPGISGDPVVDSKGTIYLPCIAPDVCAIDPTGKFIDYYRAKEK